MRWEQISEHHRKRAKLLLMFFQFAHLNHISHKEDQLRAYPLQPNNKSAFAFCHTTGVIGNQNHRGFCCRARYRSTSPHGDSRAAFFSGWLGYKQGVPWLLEPLVRTKSHFFKKRALVRALALLAIQHRSGLSISQQHSGAGF